MTGSFADARRTTTVPPYVFLVAVIPIHFFCFYWWSSYNYFFTGDGLYYFSRQIHSLTELATRFTSLDELYQYRPLTYVVFTFVLFPLFGTHPYPYHLTGYLLSSINVLLACGCLFYWTGRTARLTYTAAIFLLLNPVHFFVSFGPTYIDQWLSASFYFGALLFILGGIPHFQAVSSIMFLLALMSKEHSVILPIHCVVVLLSMGVSFRDAMRKTRALWVTLAVFALFQFTIRHGRIFAPGGSNTNLEFSVSAARIIELAKGAKPAIFYPENYLFDSNFRFARPLRLAVLLPIAALAAAGLKRRPRLALSGVIWVALSLVPVVFLRQPPFPRHYHLGLPGLAILFACAIPSWRAMAAAAPILALLTIADVHLYVRESWVARASRQTRAYLTSIDQMLSQTGRSAFYVMNTGDPYFFWHVDGGAAIPSLLKRDAIFGFAALRQPLDTDAWLANGVNIVVPEEGRLTDAASIGQFPPSTDSNICGNIYQFSGVSTCAVMFRGEPLVPANGRTLDHLPIFEVAEGLVTLSRTTIHLSAAGGFKLRRRVRLVPESVDGVIVEVHGQREGNFTRILSEFIEPGHRRQLDLVVPPGQFDHVTIRVHPGPNRNEQGDWLIWEN